MVTYKKLQKPVNLSMHNNNNSLNIKKKLHIKWRETVIISSHTETTFLGDNENYIVHAYNKGTLISSKIKSSAI